MKILAHINIGTTQSKNKIKLFYSMSQNDVTNYVNSFSIEDQIDILSLAEFLELYFHRNDHSLDTAILMGKLQIASRALLDVREIALRLKERGLELSTSRVILGKKLVHTEYKN